MCKMRDITKKQSLGLEQVQGQKQVGEKDKVSQGNPLFDPAMRR